VAVRLDRPGIALLKRLAGRRWGFVLPIGALGLILLTPLAALMATTWVLGWRLQVVETGSMDPLYPSGSLVAVQPIDATEVQSGMVIVFRDPARRDRLVAHRAVRRLSAEPPSWQTQGDANREVDPWPVSASDVRGRVRWGVPGLGYVVSPLDGWTGVVVLVGGPLGLLAAVELRDHIRRRRLMSASGVDAVPSIEDLEAALSVR
jgi:signal peptidase I